MPGTIVLIHGAWQGSWAFDAWRPLLHACGWRTVAVDLPGNGWNPQPLLVPGLDCYAAHVAAVLADQPGPCVVLGHSGGGLTASQVAELVPGRVAALVYLVGMMLPSGMSFADLVATQPDDDHGGIVPYLERHEAGTMTAVPPDAARAIFLHDCPDDAAQTAASLLRPQPEAGRAVAPRLTAERYGRVPRIYVEALQDRSIDIRLQRAMQALSPGAAVISLDCGHVPQLAVPDILTERICAELARMLQANS
jgi:pimeloyl-ACP methyl ester carboxylesterase